MDARVEQTDKVAPFVPMSFPLGKAWYVLSVFSRSEFDVEREVRSSGIASYCPRERHRRVIRGRKVSAERALFTGYLFAQFDIERDGWGALLGIDGVIDILRNNNIPIQVNAMLIDRLQRAEAGGAFDYTKPGAGFVEGESVEIMEGPMAGIIATIKSARAKNRIKILANLFGSLVTANIDSCMLKRVA